MPFLIDGYNLLREIQKQLEQTLFAEAELCMVLREFLRRRRSRGTIIFDGIGPRNKERLQGGSGLQILFSGHGVEADAVMERLISENSAPKRLTVVSSDRRLRTAAKHRKCPEVKADDFWQQICNCVERPTPAREPGEKRRGTLSTAETDAWMTVFGLGKKTAENVGQRQPRENKR
jgi:predicted RNA-binding protein with PIN domain